MTLNNLQCYVSHQFLWNQSANKLIGHISTDTVIVRPEGQTPLKDEVNARHGKISLSEKSPSCSKRANEHWLRKIKRKKHRKYFTLCSSLNVHRTKKVYLIQLIRTNHFCFILLTVPKVSGKWFCVLHSPAFSFGEM